MRPNRLFPLLVLCFLFPIPSTTAQQTSGADSILVKIKNLYDGGSYLTAEIEARRFLDTNPSSDPVKVQLQKYIAFALVAQGKNDAAVDHFISALEIDSTMNLDPVLTSPKILTVFQEARTKFEAQKAAKFNEHPNHLTSQTAVSAESVTYRTILFPGLEQIHQGRNKKGYLLLGLGLAAVASSVAFDILRREARSSYISADNPQDAVSRYRTYDIYYKAEYYSVAAFIVVYVYSEIDSFLKLPPNVSLSYERKGNLSGIKASIHF
ncbi:MAG: hypothetical protein ACP5MI_02395 [Candidatus Kryptoniota bacterium]